MKRLKESCAYFKVTESLNSLKLEPFHFLFQYKNLKKKNVKRKNLFFNKSENMNKNNIYILLLFQYLFRMDFGLATGRI